MSEKTYFYDGTWAGIMTVYHCIIGGELSDGILSRENEENVQDDLFSEKLFIETDEAKFAQLRDHFTKFAGADNYNMMMWAFLSEKRGVEGHILDFIKFVFYNGKEASGMLSEDAVMRVYSAAQQVRKECHRFKGFLRFEEIKTGIYYAGIEPDNNIIMLLAPHFKRRLSSQDWIIHDKRRNSAVFFDRSGCVYREVLSFEMPENSAEEKEYKAMWLKYFNAMGIRQRKNPRLQRQFVPIRYRRNMTEFREA